ncbi:hypothetical protein HHK36_001680 [Tetracentron sinense]|uniref:non-specific serine/threonine protein kinase n=1 Tax=Tetracentron sinense TaxID=13715 RepID=A0A835DS90_TETSI|nr:hypothetical protein HHK36_001680 [Tetracentron sinense]
MKLGWSLCWVLIHLLILILLNSIKAQPFMANLSTSWTNNPSSIDYSPNFYNVSTVRFLLYRESEGFGPGFGCGFYCNGNCDNFILAIVAVRITMRSPPLPRVVWSANRNNPVRENATLQLTPEGDLVLRDVDGTLVWSTNTSGKSVAGLNMTDTGNLVLFDRNNHTVWQSFDHPTDSLLIGQKLVEGQRLTPSASELNWTEGGLFSLSYTTSQGLVASIESNPPQVYYDSQNWATKEASYVKFLNGSLALFILSADPKEPIDRITVPPGSSAQIMKFGSDGHLRVYDWTEEQDWKEVADLLTGYYGVCRYPLVCGNYGICSNGQCSCPGETTGEASYFKQINDRQPNLGCSEVTPLSCGASQNHRFLELKDITYFSFNYSDLTDTDMETCKQACSNNCSCKAALFQYSSNSSSGNCFLPSQLFSLMNNVGMTHYNSFAFVKVQISPIAQAPSSEASPTTAPSGEKTRRSVVILGSSLGAIFGVFLIISIWVVLFRKKRDAKENEEDYFDEVPAEAMDVMKVAAWCLQNDFARRPSMSVVVKVLEGVMDVEPNLDYSFLTPPPPQMTTVTCKEAELNVSAPLLPSLLSGPSIVLSQLTSTIPSHSVSLFFLCSPPLKLCFSSVSLSAETMKLGWRRLCWILVHLLILLISSSNSIKAQPYDYPIANLSTSWTNNPSLEHSVNFTDGSMVRSILLRGSFGPRFACGFYCNGTCDYYLFAVFIVQTNSGSGITSPAIGFPQVVWSANRNNPVRANATLQLTGEGDLILQDVDGTLVWSTNTSGKSVVGLNMTDPGNLVLFDRNNSTVWQSFDHPTDSLVPGQKLVAGHRLTPSVSEFNWTEGGLFSLSVTSQGLIASIGSNPPQVYYNSTTTGTKVSTEPSYVRFLNGSLALFILSAEPNRPDDEITVPVASSAQYVKFGPDGHFRVYDYLQSGGWTVVADLLTGYLGECDYPMVCGNYGICSNGQCSCPGATTSEATYFRQINDRQPKLGCSEVTPLSCGASQNHNFLELKDITYFSLPWDLIFITDMETCKQACLNNCSCKAALFRYGDNSSSGNCILPSQLYSLMNNVKEMTHYNSSAFMKVQISSIAQPPTSDASSTPLPSGKKTRRSTVILGSSLGAFFGVLLIISIWVILFRKKRDVREDEEDYLDEVPGMPTRFSFENLKIATENFNRKLGQGGFGSVFEGVLSNDTKVAVKRLDGLGQVKKSFLAEVETIGSIHHVNLVRLIGFCAEKSHRLLVYEYMCNGSLDNWIFHKNQEHVLDWQSRRKIIIDIAKGLVYLHEDCRQKIVHLDIKPQNILLDGNFNAKVSDFGLSKLIDRDQSQIMTTMRGTPGYLAPEWLSSVITEKVDVYSFGIVVMEMLCGRKNLDRSQPEESMHLLSLFKRKAEEEQLFDLLDKTSEDLQLHAAEAMEVMKVATWCLQSDFARRPSMSVVVKVLEGLMDVEPNLDYSFSTLPPSQMTTVTHKEVEWGASAPLLPSLLSGPR